MKVSALLKQSTSALLANKGRSFLTILGIIIGIAAVIALVALSSGVSDNVAGNFSSLGAKKITVNSMEIYAEEEDEPEPPSGGGAGNPLGISSGEQNTMRQLFRGSNSDPTLTAADLEDIQNISSDLVTLVSPQVTNLSEVVVDGIQQKLNLQGVAPAYFAIEESAIGSGQLFNQEALDNNDQVAVLSPSSASRLYGEEVDPVGRTFTVDEIDYQIIGVLAAEEGSGDFGPGRGREGNDIYVPYTTLLAQYELENISTIVAEARSEELVNEASAQIEEVLLANHGMAVLEDADFSVFSSQDILAMRDSTMGLFTNLLVGIAAISLLVGGIGIMNIMLVSVTERTQEIGLRKAVGAKTRHILIQFLTEAVMLTLTGGILGVVGGRILAMVASNFVSVSPVFDLATILLAVGVSVGVGIIFGLYPAFQAARKDPVEALRYE